MVYRLFVERRPAFSLEAQALKKDIQSFLGIKGLTHLRVFNRYDIENIDGDMFGKSKTTIFSEPQTDYFYSALPEECGQAILFGVEYLPGQFDQRASSAAQCVQMMFQCERPVVRSARVYCLFGALGEDGIAAVKKHLINPVESREASLDMPATLQAVYPPPEPIPTLEGFTGLDGDGLNRLLEDYGLAMDADDLLTCQAYFLSEGRDPTLTELRVIDTYWSDHCRHTTFLTSLDEMTFEHPAAQKTYEAYLALREQLGIKKPITLMQLATIAAKHLKATGELTALDESDEINACTVKITVDADGQSEPWLLLFKNETHNHPTEIEPFGGAATCLGGAIRDPLSGRGYVYQAMRVTGAGDPRAPLAKTLKGKLPQRKIVTEAAHGYSSYGNQIGLATGLVDEIYHPGYIAKHMEIGAVIGAAPASNVRRETPAPGDVVVLLGGRTGRDGCGGATGSSKTHSVSSLTECAAEVQKGNPPEERKLQRLFRNPDATALIKRCNDFGAGGVSVAIGELSEGLAIDLNAVPKKYEGLNGTELAISESQERMAVVLAAEDVEKFLTLAQAENLQATPVAEITGDRRLRMRHNGKWIVDIARTFLDTNGAEKHARAHIAPPRPFCYPFQDASVEARMRALVQDVNVCGKRGLIERFDSTIGSCSVLMPLGGVRQLTPAQAMAAKLPVLNADTASCSVMAYGFNPYISESDPYAGAYLAVVESIAKLAASGAPLTQCHLTFQEYFPRLGQDAKRWGLPAAALLGALQAQLDLRLAAIGGKDSMSGSFEGLDVPPTLVSFAVDVCTHGAIRSPEFKRAGSRIALLAPAFTTSSLPQTDSLLNIWKQTHALLQSGRALSAFTPVYGGIMEGIFKMCLGNGFGCTLQVSANELFTHCYGGMILETLPDETAGITLGYTTQSPTIDMQEAAFSLCELEALYQHTLADIYPTQASAHAPGKEPEIISHSSGAPKHAAHTAARPRVLIPVFPGTNCEYDSFDAWRRAGANPEIFIVRNQNASDITQSVEQFATLLQNSQILFLPGGFSGGDEPDGSAKFITAFLRNAKIAAEIETLLEKRDGLIGGICNGFQALIKLGLLPYGYMRSMDENCPTLTYNTIDRHQSRIVSIRVASTMSPWLMQTSVGRQYLVPISHGEGRFVCGDALFAQLAEQGQIATQYVDAAGQPTMQIDYNPNGSFGAVESMTSPDGRIFGKMGHSERIGDGLYKNVPGDYNFPMFTSAVSYFE